MALENTNQTVERREYWQNKQTAMHRMLAVGSSLVLGLIAVLGIVALLAAATGCTPSTRTRVQGAETSATHSVQSGGVTRTETRKFRIGPADQDSHRGAPTSSPAPGASEPNRGAATTPAARPTSGRQGEPQLAAVAFIADEAPAGRVPTGPALLPVSWPGGDSDSDTDPIAQAIENAARNGQAIEFEHTITETVPATTTESTLDDRGAGLDTASPEAAIGFESRKGGISLPFGGRTRGSSSGLEADLSGAAANPLVWIGGFVCVLAIVPLVIPPRRIGTAAVIFGLGAAIATLGIVATAYPWMFAVAILLGLVAAGYLGWQTWRNGSAQLALRTVAGAVETVPDDVGKAVKQRIKQAIPAKHRAAIKREISAQKRVAERKKPPAV